MTMMQSLDSNSRLIPPSFCIALTTDIFWAVAFRYTARAWDILSFSSSGRLVEREAIQTGKIEFSLCKTPDAILRFMQLSIDQQYVIYQQ